MHVTLDTLIPMPALTTPCGYGFGMAVCPYFNLKLLETVGDVLRLGQHPVPVLSARIRRRR